MRSSRLAAAAVLGAVLLAGCGSTAATGSDAALSGPPARTVQVNGMFATTQGVAVTYDEKLVPAGARASVSSTSGGGSTRVTLALTGLEPNHAYGAHAHTQPCGKEGKDAGPHFQNKVDPVQPSVDPAFANPMNEIWLDLTTDASGAAMATTTVPWELPSDRRPGSVVVHAMSTATTPGKAGTAGNRAACVTVGF